MDLADVVARRVEAELDDALEEIGEDLLGRAQRDAPIEEGTLRASGDVRVVTGRGAGVAVVSFNTPYAAKQHEELEYEHPRGGRAKYLEANLKAMAPAYRARIAAAFRKALG
jgi:hypothetical protein